MKGNEKRIRMSRGHEPDIEVIQARMFRLALYLLGSRDGLEDVVQTAMESFLKARDSFRGEGSMEAFADRITANVTRTWIKRRRRSALFLEMLAVRGEWPELDPGPAEEVLNRDRLRRVMAILERMAPRYRTAFVLYHVENRSVHEIARIEKTSESAVRTRLLRARRKIRHRARRDPVLAEWFEEIGQRDE